MGPEAQLLRFSRNAAFRVPRNREGDTVLDRECTLRVCTGGTVGLQGLYRARTRVNTVVRY